MAGNFQLNSKNESSPSFKSDAYFNEKKLQEDIYNKRLSNRPQTR